MNSSNGYFLRNQAWIVFFCLVIPWSTMGYCQDREKISIGKRASALVELPDRAGYATAFCIQSNGMFVTNRHVVNGLRIDDLVTLILEPSLETQRTVEAAVVRVDADSDLAILKVTKPGEFVSLKLASSNDLFETMLVTAFGYPFGVSLSMKEGEYPSVSINSGRITSLRRDKGEVKLIQLDAALNPGNSGGPILNESGEVVGITSFGVKSSGVNFAVPTSALTRLLSEPLVQTSVPDLNALIRNKRGPRTVTANLSIFEGVVSDYEVDFVVTIGSAPGIVFPMKPKGSGSYEAILDVLLFGKQGENWIRGQFDFTEGQIKARVLNDKIETKEGVVWLADINSIEFDESEDPNTVLVLLRDGQIRKADKANLPKVKIDLGDYPANLMLSRALNAQFEELEAKEIRYSIVVKSNGKEIVRKRDEELKKINLLNEESSVDENANESGAVPGSSSSIPKLLDQRLIRPKQVLEMDSEITDVNIAGAGEYLLVTLGNAKKLVVINIEKGTVHGEVKLKSEKVLCAGAKTHFILVEPTSRIFERYSLVDLKREAMVKKESTGTIKAISAGAASNGPFIVCSEIKSDRGSTLSFSVFDVVGLREIPMPKENENQSFLGSAKGEIQIRAASDGRTYSMWAPKDPNAGLQTILIGDKKIRYYSSRGTPGFAIPTSDGGRIMTGLLGALAPELRQGDIRAYSKGPLLPTSHAKVYMRMMPSNNDDRLQDVSVQAEAIGSEFPIADLHNVSFPKLETSREQEASSGLLLDKRLFFFVERNLIVTVPDSNDRIVLQGCNLRNEMKLSKSNFLFVSSAPPIKFLTGKMFSYQLHDEANNKRISYKLMDAPQGMEISKDGLISWKVPSIVQEETVSVVVSITNDQEDQCLEAFKLRRVIP